MNSKDKHSVSFLKGLSMADYVFAVQENGNFSAPHFDHGKLWRGLFPGNHRLYWALRNTEGIAIIELGKRDVVRHPLVQRIISAYEEHRSPKSGGASAANPQK